MKQLFATLALLLLSGCSSFHREWKTAAAQPHPPGDLSGAWEGRWVSEKNGHRGKLRGVFTRTEPHQYNAHFRATFWKIFRATYEVPLRYEEREGQFILTGEADLGKLSGGVYRYEGKATPTDFTSTYKCKYDFGVFEMKRPCPESH